LDLTHIPRAELDRKLGGILDIYEKFQGVDPREVPMKIFPAVHYSMGGLWTDYEKNASGGLLVGSPRNHETNIPNLYAIGECDYHYHGANRLGANSLLSCIFTGLMVGPGIENKLKQSKTSAAELPPALIQRAVAAEKERHQQVLQRPASDQNPYQIHAELGDLMTRAATVVRRNEQLKASIDLVNELEERARVATVVDTGSWTNQNVIFTKALMDMFPLAKAILWGAWQRDECRGAHFKPDFAMPSLQADSREGRLQEAEQWCDRFEANTDKWLKSTIATYVDGQPKLTYEEIDTSSIPPRPRLYGLVGAEEIEIVWKRRAKEKAAGVEPAAAKAANSAAMAST
jgi:succinate dehydrogenase / fumarate reductase flavoprotein subunit